jgi:hypothetical protein
MRAMNAGDVKRKFSRAERGAFVGLIFLVLLGLWQGYGAWLFGGAGHGG